MKAKKPVTHLITPAPVEQDSGAPAALRAIEAHELKCRIEKDETHAEWIEARRCLNYGDEVSEQTERRAHNRYVESLEHWDDATKKLAIFDKGVKEDRREGEKILVADAKEYFAQLVLTVDLAFEDCILRDSQSAATGPTEQEFHHAHAVNWRSAKDAAIESAKENGALPKWIF